jgi:uncharacterized protein
MEILDMLLNRLPYGDTPIPVKNVLVGAHWTIVSSMKGCGMASTMIGENPHGHSPVRDVGILHHKSAQELAGWIRSDNLLEASIGMAAYNALLKVDESQAVEVNAADVLAREGMGKNIAIVGHFPFVDRLRAIANNLWVIEKNPREGDLPEQAAADFLPQANVIAITGTALINHTLEQLLRYCPTNALVMVLGPSTPLSPALFRFGIHMISGTRIIDEAAAFQTIQQGASFPQVKGTRLLTLAAPNIKV